MAIKEGKNYTHIDKLYWPDDGYTKKDMLEYYELIAPYILPYLKNRPLAMKRFPEGIEGFSFFQKNVEGDLPKFLKVVSIPAKTIKKDIHYVICNNVRSLLYVTNLGALELHPWSSRLGRLNYPDYMIFDLDPGPNVSFAGVVQTAQVLHTLLKKAGLKSACKTSGKRGLHVYTQVKGKKTYEETRAQSKVIAAAALAQLPHVASLEHWPAKRKDKVYIDVSRNAIGQTVVAPYSLRAAPGATVSTPLEWAEVTNKLDPKKFTIASASKRLEAKGDPWKKLLSP